MNFSESNGIFKIIILKRALFIWKAWITYLKFILLMQTIFLKIDFYWWAKLLLMFKFKDSMARAHALLWGPQQFRSAQQCLSHSPWHKVWTYRLWLQNLVCFVNDFHLRSERFLRFFFPTLSPWIAAYMSKLPWWLQMLLACPQLSCNIWSGVLVCQWAR